MIRMLSKLLPGTILLELQQDHFTELMIQNISLGNYPRSDVFDTVDFRHGYVVYKNHDTMYQYIHHSLLMRGEEGRILILRRQQRVLVQNFDWARMRRKSHGY